MGASQTEEEIQMIRTFKQHHLRLTNLDGLWDFVTDPQRIVSLCLIFLPIEEGPDKKYENGCLKI